MHERLNKAIGMVASHCHASFWLRLVLALHSQLVTQSRGSIRPSLRTVADLVCPVKSAECALWPQVDMSCSSRNVSAVITEAFWALTPQGNSGFKAFCWSMGFDPHSQGSYVLSLRQFRKLVFSFLRWPWACIRLAVFGGSALQMWPKLFSKIYQKWMPN